MSGSADLPASNDERQEEGGKAHRIQQANGAATGPATGSAAGPAAGTATAATAAAATTTTTGAAIRNRKRAARDVLETAQRNEARIVRVWLARPEGDRLDELG